MKIKWLRTIPSAEIYLPIRLKKEFRSQAGRITFHFGSWKKKMTVQFKKDLPVNMIGLSKSFRNVLFIPENLSFEYRIKRNSFYLGPMILWVAANDNERLEKRLKNLQKRIDSFVPVRGMICVCSEEGINTRKKEIEGYYFQPNVKIGEQKWKKAVFYAPGAVFKRVPLEEETNKFLYKWTKGRIFNSYFFNKWEMWEWLSPDLTLRKHLPYTNKVTSIKEVKKMLNSYSSLYVKPIKGSEGRRILHIEKDGTTIKITNDTKGKSTVKRLDDYPLLKRRIKSNRPYLVQQGVATKHESRNIDFRIYMQKNEKKKWVSSGITARVSKPESIITNLRQLDYWITGPEALSQIFKLDEKSLKRQEEKIVSICTRACKKLDKKGTFGDIAIDFVVDKNLHVWILEMNLRHVYPVEDPNLAPEVKRTPFLYAMSLAGFPLKEKKRIF